MPLSFVIFTRRSVSSGTTRGVEVTTAIDMMVSSSNTERFMDNFLNQAQRLAHTWFLEITFDHGVSTYVCMSAELLKQLITTHMK